MSAKEELNVYRFALEHEDIEIVRWSPRKPSGKPILVVPGWGETMRSFSALMKDLTTLNRPLYGITHLRDYLPKGAFKDPHILQEYKADNIIKVLDMMELKRVDVIGHSEAAINVSIAATKRPDLFDEIIFVAPVSVTRTLNIWYGCWRILKKLAVDAWQAVRQPARRATYLRHTAEGARYHFSHPIRSMFELISVGKADVRYELEKISDSSEVRLLIMDKDILYPAEEVMEYMVDLSIFVEVFSGWHDELHFSRKQFVDYIKKRFEPEAKPGK